MKPFSSIRSIEIHSALFRKILYIYGANVSPCDNVEKVERCLQVFQRNKKECLRKYVTMDETQIHHFTPESNRQSGE